MDLVCHKGARRVERHELANVETPEPTKTFYPMSHSAVTDEVTSNLVSSGFQLVREEYALSKNDQQFFGVLDLKTELSDGVCLSVGIRNSVNQTLSAAMCAGERVFVCDNLAFSGEIAIARKHTVNVREGFREKVQLAISTLHQYAEVSEARIEGLQKRFLPNQEAESLLLRSYEKGVVSPRTLPRLLDEWRNPSYPEFEVRTAWSMLQAYTHIIKGRQKERPIEAATECMRFKQFLMSS